MYHQLLLKYELYPVSCMCKFQQYQTTTYNSYNSTWLNINTTPSFFKRVTPPFPNNSPLKIKVVSSPPPFWKIGRRFDLPPAESVCVGGGGAYCVVWWPMWGEKFACEAFLFLIHYSIPATRTHQSSKLCSHCI